MRKKVLIHSLVFSPDGVSTAYLYNDIAERFAESGYEVVVLTTTPHYNLVKEELVKQPLIKKWFGLFYESDFKGIKVLHVPQRKFNNTLLRIIGFAYWHALSLLLGLLQSNISLIISPSPPLTLGAVNIIIGKIKGAKVIYNVQEIYPDLLINYSKLKLKPVITLLKKLERFVYNYSDAVTTIDKIFYNTLAPRFKEPSKLVIIPNFVDVDLYKPLPSSSLSLLNKNLFPQDERILKVMYAGNIGHAQDWKPLIEVAKLLIGDPIEFWIIGEGVMKNQLQSEILENKLLNIHLIPYQPREYMPALIAYADIHFIFMSPEMEGQGFPSKVYSIMACAKPLLIISGKDTPIFNFLNLVNCAFLVNEGSMEEKCSAIVYFLRSSYEDKSHLITLGANGFREIQGCYTKASVTKQYVDLSDKLLNI
ncbi:glycosyltransferase involved in cell wall biosynthesis [Arcticibacter tournemirensis]|uniref:Glycosyltransferase family 4 protein n=1 Tax=Arcticibacter tournemirensis TaxID=699437 RepID=A0A5M9HCI7_9SPHI|nr:glycosyltransferase family 4 protein [Arcticibacter tournemirensis]KAA8484666.1 glycosyltransferase family 4 protein [Arcticibacter tournemirensis]TQM47042.1 glycosyltransferase involved in cell wall biosynthesis [Arcticibacter tournemirensis]